MRLDRRLVIVVVLGLMVGAAAALFSLPGLRERLSTASGPIASVGKAQVGGPFSLVDPAGRKVTDKDFLGRYMLVYFGFTFCPDVCPTGLQVMASALDQLGPKADRIAPLFITLDLERDTPQQMGEYVKAFHPRILGLTGTSAEIAEVARAYRVYFKKVTDEESTAGYTVDHTSIMYVMDTKGEFVAHFTHATAVDAIVSRLQKLL